MVYPTTTHLQAHQKDALLYYTFPAFDRVPFVRHGFSTRLGGVSRGVYESMNLSFTRGDDDAAVQENFHRFCEAIGVSAEQVVVSAQAHHTNIYNATAADCGRGVTRERGYTDIDGLLTDEPGVVLCTQYADCVPLFFVDPVRRVVGTSHSGWRGTVARIGAVTVERMCRNYGCRREDILAAVGPSICQDCYEVSEEVIGLFRENFVEELWPKLFYGKENGHYQLNLWEANRSIFEGAGILPEHITVTDVCTACNPELLFSHRASGGKRGNLAGFLGLRA